METYVQRSIRHCLNMIASFEGTGQQEDLERVLMIIRKYRNLDE